MGRLHCFECHDRQFVYDGESMLLGRLPLVHKTLGVQCDPDSDGVQAMARRAGMLAPVTQGLDVLRELRAKWADEARIGSLQLLVSAECNMRCAYCYAHQGDFRGVARERFMSREVAEAAMDAVLPHAGEALVVALLGGEPLLNPSLADIVRCIARSRRHSTCQVAITISTNGTVFDSELAAILRDVGAQVSISVDGPEAIHDSLRPRKGGGGSWRLIQENLERWLAALTTKFVSLRATCTSTNVHSLYDWVRIHSPILRRYSVRDVPSHSTPRKWMSPDGGSPRDIPETTATALRS